MSRSVAWGVAIAAAAWVLLLLAAPTLWTPLAGVLYVAGSFICHQLPDRSFHLQTIQLPVCGRCLGLYGGAAVGSIAAAAVGRHGLRTRSTIWIATALAALPTIVTAVLEWGLGWPISNAARAVAAVPLGGVIAFVVIRTVPTLH